MREIDLILLMEDDMTPRNHPASMQSRTLQIACLALLLTLVGIATHAIAKDVPQALEAPVFGMGDALTLGAP
jgi:hypothetical protein